MAFGRRDRLFGRTTKEKAGNFARLPCSDLQLNTSC
jgi:hypothetical protein